MSRAPAENGSSTDGDTAGHTERRQAAGKTSMTDAAGPAPRVRPRLAITWLLGNLAVSAVWGAIPSVLLAVQFQLIDPAAKVQNLALVTGIAAALTIVVQPLVGRLSDATRSRFGRRSPWIVVGSVAGALGIIAMAFVSSIPALIALYLVVVIGVNAASLPFSATLAERIPVRRRGVFSSVAAIGQFGGIVAGQAIAAALLGVTPLAYVIVGLLLLASLMTFVLLNPERSTTDAPRERLSWRRLVGSYWFDPVAHPDFAWALVGRVLLGLGFYLVSSYSLYMLQDYIGLSLGDATTMIPLLSLIAGAAMIVSTVIAGPLSDRLRRRKVFLYAASALFAVSMAIPFFAPTLEAVIVSQLLGGVAFGCLGSVDQALLTQVLPDAPSGEADRTTGGDTGKDLGIGYVSLNLPTAIAPFIAGAVIGAGGYAPLFLLAAVLSVLGGASVFFIRGVR
jgi:MFS family permease